MTEFRHVLTFSLRPEQPGTVNVEGSFSFPQTFTGFSIAYNRTISAVRRRGFDREDDAFVWDGETVDPSFRGTIAVDRNGGGGYDWYDDGGWALTSFPGHAWNCRYRGGNGEYEMATEARVAGEGVASDDGSLVYLGPYREWTRTAGGQTFRLVVPEAATLGPSPRAVLDLLTAAGEALRIGERRDRVLAVAVPSDTVRWSAAGRHPWLSTAFWVQDDRPVETVGSTWVHEYVHARTGFERTEAAEWLLEAMADYFAASLALRTGNTDFESFHRHVSRSKDGGAVLAAPGSWPSPYTPYIKGRRVLAALEAAIRQSGDGTLQDVFRRLNEVDGEVTHTEFADTVADVAGVRLDDWLDRHVRGRENPTVPADPDLFGAPERPRPTGTGDGEPDDEESGPTGEGPDTDEDEQEDGGEGEDGPDTGPETDTEGPGPEPPSGEDEDEREDDEGDDADGDSDADGDGETDDGDGATTCPTCRTVTDAAYCPGCGTAMARTCPVCGVTQPDGEFCRGCGHPFVDECPVCGSNATGGEYCGACGASL